MPDETKHPHPEPPAGQLSGDCERRYRQFADTIPLGLFRVIGSNPGRVLWVNPAMVSMLGYDDPGRIIGSNPRDLFINPGEFQEIVSGLMEAGSVPGREIRLRRPDGSETWVSLRAWMAGTDECGNGIIDGFCEDVTERRVFEQEMHYHESELNRYAQALTLANRKLNLLSSITRHDILNKLTGFQGYIDLIRTEYSDPALLGYLEGEEEILAIITQQIMFTRDYQEVGIQAPQWFDARESVRAAAEAIPLPGVTLSVDCRDLWVYADPLLEKVFYNLIDNARSHGRNLTRISFSAEVTDHAARIICEDDGGGIPARFKEAIFIRKHFTHTGFGLFLSREILGITGMTIQENGEPGEGARFVITIPRMHFRTGNPPSAE